MKQKKNNTFLKVLKINSKVGGREKQNLKWSCSYFKTECEK